MKLILKNIGKITNANIELNGITVIAGKNNTGKSTIGKSLFCVVNGLYSINQHIIKDRLNAIINALDTVFIINRNFTEKTPWLEYITEFSKQILQNRKTYTRNKCILLNIIHEFVSKNIKENFINEMHIFVNIVTEKIMQILTLSDEDILINILQNKFDSEFNSQINRISIPPNENTVVKLKINEDSEIDIFIKNNKIYQIKNLFNLKKEIIYIDDPYIIDDLNSSSHSCCLNHKEHLKEKLAFKEQNQISSSEKIIIEKKIKRIYEKINTVCRGELIELPSFSTGYGYKEQGYIFDIRNVSTGLKSFLILKRLLQNSGLKDENGFIIMDTPEIHLHPEWQLLFAELIVLIQKEFRTRILLSTYSPYFLNTIEVYAAKYKTADKCKYYYLKAEENKDKSEIYEVKPNDIEKALYEKHPFQNLENVTVMNNSGS